MLSQAHFCEMCVYMISEFNVNVEEKEWVHVAKTRAIIYVEY